MSDEKVPDAGHHSTKLSPDAAALKRAAAAYVADVERITGVTMSESDHLLATTLFMAGAAWGARSMLHRENDVELN